MRFASLFRQLLVIFLKISFVDGKVLPDQFPQLREHFFSVIHVIGRNGSETQYAQYQPYPENGVVYLDALKSFENPCQFENFTDLRDLEIHIQLPCAGNQTDQTEFLSLFTIFPLNFSDCHRDKATKLFYSLAKVDEKHHAFLPKVDFSDYKSKINLSEYPIENRPIVRISHWSSECEVKCSDSLSPRDVIVKNAQCGAMERTGDETKVCDFSSNESCNWEFVAAGGYKFEIKEENFTSHSGWLMERMAIVSGLPRSPVDPPMIVSPYFVHTAATCLMEISYRVNGIIGHSRIVISTETRSSKNASANQINDSPQPIVHAILQTNYRVEKLLREHQIPLGHFGEPTRIRIECQNANAKDRYSVDPNRAWETNCSIHHINMIGCEEHPDFKDLCPEEKEEYLCKGKAIKKCINIAWVCDGHVDCPHGDDEENCEWPVPGSRCDFENNATLCPDWTTITQRLHHFDPMPDDLLVKANYGDAMKDWEYANIPHRDQTPGTIEGHFLWASHKFQKNYKSRINENPFFQRFQSPFFPPTVSHDDEKHETCFIRYWYCEKMPHEMLEWKIYKGFKGAEDEIELQLLFPKEQGLDWKSHCDWKRAAVKLMPQRSPFQVGFTFNVYHVEAEYLLMIDDISLSPSCFKNENPIEVSHQMDTCGATGFNPPTTEDCERFLKKTGKKLEKVPDFVNGIQHWKVSEALQYRIEICGAAGGSHFDKGKNDKGNADQGKNFGGCVHSLVDLNVYQTLTVSLGQRGETSCQHNPTDPLCARGSGSGGGGASMVFLNDVLILVAGGGGGLLSKGEIDHTEGIPEDISVGGRTHSNESWSHLDEEIKKSKDFIDNSIIMYKNVSGFGVSFKPGHIVKIASNCSDCSMLNGEKKTANGGTCVDSRVEAKGGFGGGGASCGKGAGGGGGFLGGAPGDDTAGWGGSSWSNADAVLQTEFRSGKNNKDGTFMIYACQLKCPQNARCVFETPVDQKMKCTCADGVVVEENELCASDKEPFYRALLFLLIFLCFLFSVGYCCYCLMKRRMRKAQRQKHAYHCEMEARVEARLRANITSELQRLSNDDNNALRFLLEQIEELPKIERSNLLLLEPLGVGAFGEVFKAKMRRDQTTIEVAVKTLPFSSSKQAQDEFFMEAQIMNKFRHDNIVSFFGINFDVTPRYIVLELMKGGDLKSFLRTSRSTKIDPNPNNLLMLDLVSMCLDVAKGCEFLAANKFIHRDIAARNCLLTSQAHDRVVKIGDFGMARDVYRTDYYRKGGRALLPVKWMPPEALLDGYFTTKTDVWSFGILTWEVFSLGYMPYPGRNNMEVLDLISKGGRLEPPIGTPSQIHQIMLQCWKTRVETRPTFTTIIHWLQKLADDPIIRSQPIPDKNLSMPSTAQQTPCVETPRSEITVTTGLNSPSSSKEMLHMNESFGIDTDEFTCVVSSPYVIKNFAQSIPKNSYIQPILEEVGNENGKEDTLITVDSSEQQSCGQQICGQQICGQQIEQFQDPLSNFPETSFGFNRFSSTNVQANEMNPEFVVPARRRRPNTLPTKLHNNFESINQQQDNNAFEFL